MAPGLRPSARRCGTGRALLQAVRQAATAAGATRLSVQTEPANTAALQLYRTSGFTPVHGIEALIHERPPSPDARTARCARRKRGM